MAVLAFASGFIFSSVTAISMINPAFGQEENGLSLD